MFRIDKDKWKIYIMIHIIRNIIYLPLQRRLQNNGKEAWNLTNKRAESIGEAWASLEVDLNVIEAENISDNTSMAAIYHSIPAIEENRMEGEGKGRLGLISQ